MIFYNSEVPENRSEVRLSGTSEYIFFYKTENKTKQKQINDKKLLTKFR